jgi:glycosyltransferase involved in cell wall biosynthesis
MRIAVTNHHRQVVGGTESYLTRVIPELTRRGHEVSFWHENVVAPGAATIEAPEVFAVGADALERLKTWGPALIYNHGLTGMQWEASLGSVAPVVHYVHNYYGTCISGEKTRKFPSPRACDRRFGPACLAQYLPRQCGGNNPFTMWRDYQVQSQRLEHLRHFAALAVASRYIENEYRKHGFTKVHRVPLFVNPPDSQLEPISDRLVFCGRMMSLKGGHLLLDAIPAIERLLGRPVEVIFAGDGPERAAWEARGTKAQFTGWISHDALRDLRAALLVMPSLWPEPFGLAGLELGLPVAAFPSGGICDWLHEGVNGHLAASLTADGIADAVARCLGDSAHFQQLRLGAVRIAAEYSMAAHMECLLSVFEENRK